MQSATSHEDILGELIRDQVEVSVRLGRVESQVNVFTKIILEGNNGQHPIMGQLLVMTSSLERIAAAQREQDKKIEALTKSEDDIRKEKIKGYFAVALAIIGAAVSITVAWITLGSKS